MEKKLENENSASPEATDKPDLGTCGLIMPISGSASHSSAHWSEVRQIFETAVKKAGMKPQIVSDSFETDVIQSRIVHNLYDNPVVVCDVSGLNPNVMFELGMRITFKKPVIVVTDDISSIPFDTKVIEHLAYPQDLHFHKIGKFIAALTSKIESLLELSNSGNFRSFIEEFGQFNVLQPTEVQVGSDKIILDELSALKKDIRRIRLNDTNFRSIRSPSYFAAHTGADFENDLENNQAVFEIRIPTNLVAKVDEITERITNDIVFSSSVTSVSHRRLDGGIHKIGVTIQRPWTLKDAEEIIHIIEVHGGQVVSTTF